MTPIPLRDGTCMCHGLNLLCPPPTHTHLKPWEPGGGGDHHKGGMGLFPISVQLLGILPYLDALLNASCPAITPPLSLQHHSPSP